MVFVSLLVLRLVVVFFSELVNDFLLIFAIHQEYFSMIGDAVFNKQEWTQVMPPLVGECCDSVYSHDNKL